MDSRVRRRLLPSPDRHVVVPRLSGSPETSRAEVTAPGVRAWFCFLQRGQKNSL
jgi:hypothetical protein